MPSPFPGMNPYLENENVWEDFHVTFVPHLRALLSPQVVPRYYVRVEEHIFIHEADGARRLAGHADVAVTGPGPAHEVSRPAAVAEAPATVLLPTTADRERHPYLEIRDRQTHEIVTVLEVLSPSNKYAGDDRDRHVRKREDVLASGANLVEIDLLRGGPRLPITEMPECDYCVVVSRPAERPRAHFWPILLRDRLPSIPVPLRPGEADAALDLQTALHHVYDAAGYEYFIYNHRPQPQLRPEDDAWARQFLPPPPPVGNGTPRE
jgi:hypothetical protein